MEWSQTWLRVGAFVFVCCVEWFDNPHVPDVCRALSSMAERFRLVIQMRLLFLILSSCFCTGGSLVVRLSMCIHVYGCTDLEQCAGP